MSTMRSGITPHVKYINIFTTKYKKKQDCDGLKAYTHAFPLHISLIYVLHKHSPVVLRIAHKGWGACAALCLYHV